MLKVVNQRNAFIIRENDLNQSTIALDTYSYAISNILVGNEETYPTIEIIDGFAEFQFLENTFIAITGNAQIFINGKKIDALWKCLPIKKGSSLKISTSNGSIAYLAISGGFVNNPLGRIPLNSNDEVLEVASPPISQEDLLIEVPARHLPPRYIPPQDPQYLKVVPLSDSRFLPNRCLVSEKDPIKGVSLKPVNKMPLESNILEGDPPPRILTKNDEDLLVLSSPSDESKPLLGVLPRNSFDALLRKPIGSSLSFIAISPSQAIREEERYLNKLNKIKHIINLAVNAIKRGATLVKIRFRNTLYEAWIEELI